MATSIPPESRWSGSTSQGEVDFRRWCLVELDDTVLVLPQVMLTVRDRARPPLRRRLQAPRDNYQSSLREAVEARLSLPDT